MEIMIARLALCIYSNTKEFGGLLQVFSDLMARELNLYSSSNNWLTSLSLLEFPFPFSPNLFQTLRRCLAIKNSPSDISLSQWELDTKLTINS